MRGNRRLKSNFLDEIDDPHGDYRRARATGYEETLVSPGWENISKHDDEVNALLSTYTHPERASSSSVARIESSSSTLPTETNTCKHGVKTKKQKKCKKRKTLSEGPIMEARKREAARLIPKYEIGEKVRFASDDGMQWLHGVIRQRILPGFPGNSLDNPHVIVMYLIEHRDDQTRVVYSEVGEGLIDQSLHGQENPRFRRVPKPGSPSDPKTTLVVRVSLAKSLHDLDLVGIGTCSAVSVSTEKEDFIFVDESRTAKDSVTLRGVGGSSSVIGGRGPMVVKTKDKDGNEVLMFDPSAVYLNPDELDDSQARFRIFGQAKLKRAGLKIVQDKYGDDEDYLVYRNGEMEIPMETNNDIVTVRTMPLDLTEDQNLNLEQYIEEVLRGSNEERAFVQMNECNSFIMNEANLSPEERARLAH